MHLERLLEAYEQMGPRERKILATLAMRIMAGQRKFGKLSIDKKDWRYEAIEEAMDASVYLACALNDKADKAFNAMVVDAETEANKPEGEWWTKPA